MSNVSHLITASVLALLMAFSPMTISMIHDDVPRVGTISFTTN